MLIEFRVKNFKSFRDEQVLSMVASSDRILPENTITTKSLGNRKLVRSAVVYGANASGKSNLVAAFDFVRNFVMDSAKRKRSNEIPIQPFRLDSSSRELPSAFEINFIQQDIRYQYNFAVDCRRVYEESLVAYPKGLPQTWFERSPKPDSEESNWYFGPTLKGEKKKLTLLTRPDVLFLSVAATFNHQQLSHVYKWFSEGLGIVDTSTPSHLLEQFTAKQIKEDKGFQVVISKMLQFADLGIIDISVEEANSFQNNLLEDIQALLPTGWSLVQEDRELLEVQMRHYSKDLTDPNALFSIKDESLGTRRFFAIAGPLFYAWWQGYTLVVDELDTSLHPTLVRALARSFHIPNKNAQLIFNTHDTTLLDSTLFRRDQVWFVEKDNSGASHLYPLLDFSPRKDEALAKGYLQGRYGAIPFIGELPKELIPDAQE